MQEDFLLAPVGSFRSRPHPRRPIPDFSGNNLKERRQGVYLTQEELAELVGVSKQTVGFWEQGRRYPTLTHVAKLREMLYEKLRSVRKSEQRRQRMQERREIQAILEGQ